MMRIRVLIIAIIQKKTLTITTTPMGVTSTPEQKGMDGGGMEEDGGGVVFIMDGGAILDFSDILGIRVIGVTITGEGMVILVGMAGMEVTEAMAVVMEAGMGTAEAMVMAEGTAAITVNH
jgi:hypothetical protein